MPPSETSTVVRARAVFEDSQTLKLASVDGKPLADDRIAFEHCIVATGSSPTRIPAFDLPTHRVMDSTGALELPDVPESLLVVGGGYIGLEMGTVYAALGSRVSVVEMTDGLLPGADRDLVRPLQKRLQGIFEAIYLERQGRLVGRSARFDRSRRSRATCRRRCGDSAACCFASAGVRTPPGWGWKRPASKSIDRGFIAVDRQRRTADPHILAIGDVAGEPMLAHKAAHEGKTAVEALLGKSVAFEPKAIPAVVFTDPEIAWAGLTETEAKRQGRTVEVAQFPWAASGRAQAIGRTEGLTKWIVDPQTQARRRLRHRRLRRRRPDQRGRPGDRDGLLGPRLAETIHPHPTLSETLGCAAEVHLGLATDLYRPRSGIKRLTAEELEDAEETVKPRSASSDVLRGQSCSLPRRLLTCGLVVPAAGPDPLLHVRLQHAEGGFVPLDGQAQGVQHALGRVEVRDDPLRDRNRMRRHSERLRIQAEIDDQFFRRAGNTAEVGVQRHHLGIVDFHLHPLWDLRGSLPGRLAAGFQRGGGIVFRSVRCLGHGILLSSH